VFAYGLLIGAALVIAAAQAIAERARRRRSIDIGNRMVAPIV
jgi:hypothetical protein